MIMNSGGLYDNASTLRKRPVVPEEAEPAPEAEDAAPLEEGVDMAISSKAIAWFLLVASVVGFYWAQKA